MRRSLLFLCGFAILLLVPLQVNATEQPGLVFQGYEKVKKGWGDDLGSFFEELWSYVIHGHGRRSKRAIYVPADFDGRQNPSEGIGVSGSEDDPLDPSDPSYPSGYFKSDDVVVPPQGKVPGTAPAPEPGTLGAILAGVLGVLLLRRRTA